MLFEFIFVSIPFLSFPSSSVVVSCHSFLRMMLVLLLYGDGMMTKKDASTHDLVTAVGAQYAATATATTTATAAVGDDACSIRHSYC
mmetsp:Transcript_27476/g.31501  ORF Transcript_27476/g.31501 Transcript_27476/m.31501 type:complete len:87 (+) Transcript_27476:726-986(+)